jgi:hypothetical protein
MRTLKVQWILYNDVQKKSSLIATNDETFLLSNQIIREGYEIGHHRL